MKKLIKFRYNSNDNYTYASFKDEYYAIRFIVFNIGRKGFEYEIVKLKAEKI